jgi:hypothetical protein
LATVGRLVFAAGMVELTLRADPLLPAFYQAHFSDQQPCIQVRGRVVTVRPGRSVPLERTGAGADSVACVTLNGLLPWEIEVRGGVARLNADLRGVCLRALDLGSISGSVINLPGPDGIVYIYIAGSISDLSIHHPPEVGVCVHINGSATSLRLGERQITAAADGLEWQNDAKQSTTCRYMISIAGSVSNLIVSPQTASKA